MSTVAEIEEAASKLSPKEFARLMEDLRDLQEGRAALAELQAGKEETISLDELESRLGQ